MRSHVTPEGGQRDSQRQKAALDAAERLLDSYWLRLALSLLIIVSVLPLAAQLTLFPDVAAGRLDPFFLAIFGLEFAARLAVFVRKWRERRAGAGELLLLLLDLLAVLSFLPLSGMLDSKYLRLVRLTRMLLLLGYWGRMARELLLVLSGPERRYQVIGVVFLGLVLSFGSAVLVKQLAPEYDFNGDGMIDDSDRGFFRILWWSFHQVQDTGYLVNELDQPLIVFVSLLLTFSGLLLFSLVIGIGTGAIEEVLVRSREQPLALTGHTVVLGLTPHSVFLLEGLARIYQKNLKAFRAAVLGPSPEVPAYLHRPLLRAFQYRSGDPVRAADLERVNIRRARRVLILGSHPRHPDGEVISAILATRERNPHVHLYPDVEHERNFRAVLSAGGPRTHLVGSGSFLGHYIVHNVVYPGAYHVYRQLLTSSGSEVYTYLFSPEERRQLLNNWRVKGAPEFRSRASGATAEAEPSFDPADLYRSAYRRFGVTTIGLFVRDGDDSGENQELKVLLNPARAGALTGASRDVFETSDAGSPPGRPGRVRWAAVRGLAGVSLRWAELRRLGRRLIESPAAAVPAAGVPAAGATAGGRPSRVRGRSPSSAPTSWCGFETLELRPACSRLGRVLISGASPRIPRVITELTSFFPRLEVTVLVRDAGRLRRITRGIQAALLGAGKDTQAVEHDGSAELSLRRGADATRRADSLRISILEADWTDHERLRRAGAVDLESADAVLLLPGASRAEELDGAVALDCLHLANLARSGDLSPRSGLHVVGMVRDAVKGDLLESRLEKIAGAGSAVRFTIISSERARNHFIMQNVFVRGLNALYLQLLNAEGQHLSRLIPGHPDGAAAAGGFDPADLGDHLLTERGMVFLGLELEDDSGGYTIELDPRKLPPGRIIPWRSVRAIYALAAWEDLVTPQETQA